MRGRKRGCLALLLSALLAGSAVPASAAVSYPMDYVVWYAAGDGTTLSSARGRIDAAVRDTLRVESPAVDGYALRDPADAVVTGDRLSWRFPPSGADRSGTGSYTVYYDRLCRMTVLYLYAAGKRAAAPPRTATGRVGDGYRLSSPAVAGCTPTRDEVSGRFSAEEDVLSVCYYENVYAVSFDANGGTGAPRGLEKAHFTPLTLPARGPIRAGHVLLGWSADRTAAVPSYAPGGAYDVNGDATLFAVWEPETYVVSLDANGGTGAPPPFVKTYGQTARLPDEAPSRDGYVFAGWAPGASDPYAAYRPGDPYEPNVERVLYAVWEPEPPARYAVVYHANGGNGAPPAQTKVQGRALALSSAVPSRTGYDFLGWAASPSSREPVYRPGDPYGADAPIALYAVWACRHGVTETVWDAPCRWRRVCAACGAALASGTAHGPYVYGPWTYADGTRHRRLRTCCRGDFQDAEYAAHRLADVCEPYSAAEHLRRAYCADCGSYVGEAVREGHSFVVSVKDGRTVRTCRFCGYAETSLDAYRVSYDGNGGRLAGGPAFQTKVRGVPLTIPDAVPVRPGYAFAGWAADASARTAAYAPGGAYVADAPATLFAVWTYVPRTFPVSFDANGGTGAPGPLRKVEGVPLALPEAVPVWTGRVFQGWAAAGTEGRPAYRPGAPYEDDAPLALRAVWAAETYAVSLDPNGGTGGRAVLRKTFGAPLPLPERAPERAGFRFLGWSPDRRAAEAAYAPGDAYTADAPATLFAVWAYVPRTFPVSFDANGGTGAPGPLRKVEGVPLALPEAVPVRDGHAFQGWAAGTDGRPAYQPGAPYEDDAPLELRAVWEADRYPVSYDANGGTGAPSPQEKTHGLDLALSAARPERDGFAFLGWATEPDGGVAYEAGATYAADRALSLYAAWLRQDYDFSVSELTADPEEVPQYGRTAVRFRADSWDRSRAYQDVPVEVLLNGTRVYAGALDFPAYGVRYVAFLLNVGAASGDLRLTARINWAGRAGETHAWDNYTTATIRAARLEETSIEAVPAGGPYLEGLQVVSSFLVTNEGARDILPADGVAFEFLAYTMEDGAERVWARGTVGGVVIPANGRNLVYFKWTVPPGSAGAVCRCRGTINGAGASRERVSSNNTAESSAVIQGDPPSRPPDTRFERRAPAGYAAGAAPPAETAGSASWDLWVCEGGRPVLRTYGITAGGAGPEVSVCPAVPSGAGERTIRAGYGVSLTWRLGIEAAPGCLLPEEGAFTGAQRAYAAFPEFGYSTEDGRRRTLEPEGGTSGFTGTLRFPETFRFPENPEADGNGRLHFLPVYTADGAYVVSAAAGQIWTPVGPIGTVRHAAPLTVLGALYDDYYVGRGP